MNRYSQSAESAICLGIALSCLLALPSCKPQNKDMPPKTAEASFTTVFNAGTNDQDLLLGCIVYAEETSAHLQVDSTSQFYRITTIFQEDARSGANTDSLINDFIKKHENIDFTSNKARRRIQLYIDCHKLVNDVIFGKIDSDDKSEEMKRLEDKILGLPDVLKIYRSYVPPGNTLASLSSSGVALDVQMAYYLSTLDIYKRNEVLKALF